MIRNLDTLTQKTYDILVIGGGITGACIAWDATLRGLSVALVERDDFGAATSANSLKTVHGGLRYLQDANLAQLRKMVRERQAYLRIAPHLVRPLTCLMPTYERPLLRSRPLLTLALKLNDLLSLDRNWGMDPARSLPAGQILSRDDCLARMQIHDDGAISGGVLWYDAQVSNTERMVLSFILSAAERGASVANYVAVTRLLRHNGRVVGAQVADRLTDQSLQIRAHIVVNAAGPWADEILNQMGDNGRSSYLLSDDHLPAFRPSTAINLVTRQILPDIAVAINSHYKQELPDGGTKECSRILFIAPWRNNSIVGTLHETHQGAVGASAVTKQTIDAFLEEVNEAYPPARLTPDDVDQVHFGYLPLADQMRTRPAHCNQVKLLRTGRLIDHSSHDTEGLVTTVGVKYTTARHLAEKTVDLLVQKLGRSTLSSDTRFQRLYGGAIIDWNHFSDAAVRNMMQVGAISRPVARHLVQDYGSAYPEILSYVKQDACWAETVGAGVPVTRAEVAHAVRAEMALKLSDVIRRRTPLGSAGPPDSQVVYNCACIMAEELGWDRHSVDREIDDLYTGYPVGVM